MKKLMLIAALVVASVSAHAQNDELKNEIGVYYGFMSASNYGWLLSGAFSAAFSSSSQDKFWGPIGVEYYHHVTPAVALGGVASIAGCQWSNDHLKSKYIAVMPSVKLNWLRKNHWGLYSSASAGVLIVSDKVSSDYNGEKKVESDNSACFMFHVSALGVEAGGEAFRGFVEAGFGEKGILCAGLRYKF
ncbi:MAG: hypothetical protein J6I31_03050 [Prevotella sp.]|nr:hypothetical protein [Prevotella sp.]